MPMNVVGTTASDWDNVQPEVARWALKYRISGCRSLLQLRGHITLLSNSRWSKTPDLELEIPKICHSSRDICISGFVGHITNFGYRSLSQTRGNTFLAIVVIVNHKFAFGFSTLTVAVHGIKPLPVWLPHYHFQCRSQYRSSVCEQLLRARHGRNPCRHRYMYFRFRPPHCYSRSSVIIAGAWRQILPARCIQKPLEFWSSWRSCCSSRDSISGLGSRVDFWLSVKLSTSFGETSFELALSKTSNILNQVSQASVMSVMFVMLSYTRKWYYCK